MTRESWVKTGTQKQRQKWATEHPLAWTLEYQPTILLPGKGQIPFEPWPFQQDFMSCRDRFRAINKPRQCGISTTAADEAAWEFDNIPGAQIVIISKDKDAAVNFHKYVRNILWSIRKKNPNAPRIIKDNERETTNTLGNRIVSLAASKESGRSFSATHLYFDELAFVQYAEEIWQAASATLAQTGGRVTAISTPKGRANLFYRIFEQDDHMGFTLFSYAWWDVPTYNPYYDEYIAAQTLSEKQKWIAKAKTGAWYRSERPKFTDLAWRQEFEGAFDANAGSVFSTRSLERVFKRNWLEQKDDPTGVLTEWWTSEKQKGRLYVTGTDLGRKNDPTIMVTYDITDYDPSERDSENRFLKPAVMVDYKYIEAGSAEWSEIEMAAKTHLKFWQPDAQHDGTGSGDSFSEAMYGLSEPFMFTKDSKQGIITVIQHAFDYGAVRLPKIPRLYREHQRYTWEDKDIQQDTVMANGLAIDLFHDGQAEIFLGFKKVGFMSEAIAA